MPRKPTKPWNADKDLFPALDGRERARPKPMPDRVSPSHSTGTHVPERWHVYDERDEPYRVGGHPWAGNEARAQVEAARLTREAGGRWVARRVVG
jgi:hypothetical protein